MTAIGKVAFEQAYQINPILLQGGIAQFLPGQTLPIGLVTEMFDIPGILSGTGVTTNNFFAQFKPISGGTLSEWQIAEYPFANMQMAANAVVQMPLKISLAMIAPAQTPYGYITKIAQFTAIKKMIDAHIQSGGYFTVLTPAYVYTNCLLRSIKDITPTGDKQVQYIYQWDFEQPLITAQAAQSVLGQLFSNLGGGLPTQSITTWGNTASFSPISSTNSLGF